MEKIARRIAAVPRMLIRHVRRKVEIARVNPGTLDKAVVKVNIYL